MAVITQPTAAVTGSANGTAEFASRMPGFDASAVIAAQEHGLAEYLNRPVQEILAQLGFPPLPAAQAPGPLPPGPPGAPPNAPASPMDPGALIQPVTDALGTLGTGMFDALDPTAMFDSISQALTSSNGNVAAALSGIPGNWEGAGGTAATAKTATALDNGAAVNAQASALRNSLTAAAATVKQAEARLIEIISEFMATMAAIGPNIIFPWGWAAAIAAATEAVTRATETMTELQATLAAQTAEVTSAGEPVPVTDAPIAAATAQTNSASAGSQGLSALMDSAAKAAQTGAQTATDLASQLGGAAATQGAAAPIATSAASTAPTRTAAGGGSAGGGGVGGGGIAGGTGANTLAARSAPAMPPMSEDIGRAAASSARAGAALGAGMGAPMMGGAPFAPMAHGGRMAGGDHTAPAFLQTTDHGDEIVGDLGTAAPPVIGEA